MLREGRGAICYLSCMIGMLELQMMDRAPAPSHTNRGTAQLETVGYPSIELIGLGAGTNELQRKLSYILLRFG